MIDVGKLIQQQIEKMMMLEKILWEMIEWKTHSRLKDFVIFELDTRQIWFHHCSCQCNNN